MDVTTTFASGPLVIAHGITTPEDSSMGALPKEEQLLLTSDAAVHQTMPGDRENLYYAVDSGDPSGTTTFSVFVTV